MTRDDRFIGILEDYLDTFDGDTPLPGHVRNAIPPSSHERGRSVLAGVQRGSMTMMTNAPSGAPWAIAAAAVVVAIVGGAWFLSGSRSDIGSASPTRPDAVPTVAPMPSPTGVPHGVIRPRPARRLNGPHQDARHVDRRSAGDRR